MIFILEDYTIISRYLFAKSGLQQKELRFRCGNLIRFFFWPKDWFYFPVFLYLNFFESWWQSYLGWRAVMIIITVMSTEHVQFYFRIMSVSLHFLRACTSEVASFLCAWPKCGSFTSVFVDNGFLDNFVFVTHAMLWKIENKLKGDDGEPC